MKHVIFLTILLIVAIIAFSACGGDEGDNGGGVGGGSTSVTFDTADTKGDTVSVTAGDVTFDMIYTNETEGEITFPATISETSTTVAMKKFFMGKTEVTWALWKEVYDWAVDADRGANVYTFQNIGQKGNDAAADKSLQHPVTMISWRDVVIWCNALSEMTGAEVVYVANGTNGTTDGGVLRSSADGAYGGNNVEDVLKIEADTQTRKGYRLPASMEWEYAARYRGSDSTNMVSGYSNPYYTKGDSASGASTYYNDNTDGSGEPGKTANDLVAVYGYYWDGAWIDKGTSSTAEVMSLGTGSANILGMYDMSGNVYEWCFTASGSLRLARALCVNKVVAFYAAFF